MKKYFKLVLLLGISLIFLTGCVYDLVIPESDLNSEATGDNSTSGDQEDGVVPGKGTLKIYLTDASGNYKENDSGTYSAVYITISNVEGHIAGDDDGAEGSWEPLKGWSGGFPVNLIELEDVSILLASLELEPNKYTQLRLFLMGGEEDAWIVLEGSEESEPKIPLEIPSVYQTGIKLNRAFEIVTDGITKLTIDFDADKSVVKTGNGKYKLKPVIHMTSETLSEEDIYTGSVSGTVSYYGYDNDSEDSELILVGIYNASLSLSGGEYIFVYYTTTSENGLFEFLENIPIGNCVLNVYADDFEYYFESIVVEEGVNEVNVVFLLETPGGISGSVVDSDGGEPIEGANISVALSGDVYIFSSSTLTDVNGEFTIEQLPVGTYDLTVSADGYSFYSHAGGIAVAVGEINDIGEITLSTPSP